MKTIKILILLFLSLILTSCRNYNGNFWTEKAIIIKKEQDVDDRTLNQAHYTIRFSTEKRLTCQELILILSENFGEVGDVVTETNRILHASSELEKTK